MRVHLKPQGISWFVPGKTSLTEGYLSPGEQPGDGLRRPSQSAFKVGTMEVPQSSSFGLAPPQQQDATQQQQIVDPMAGVIGASGLPPPQLQNIVATVNLSCQLQLKEIAMKARNAEYNPKRFAAVIMRIRDPKTTALIFASGKMVVTGARSEDQARLAGRKYARIVQKLGFNPLYKVRIGPQRISSRIFLFPWRCWMALGFFSLPLRA